MGGVGCWAGHVELADLVAALGEVAEGDELGSAAGYFSCCGGKEGKEETYRGAAIVSEVGIEMGCFVWECW